MSEYGMIYDTSSIKQYLKEANRDYMGRKTWENLYAGIDIAEKQPIGVLKQDYAKAIDDIDIALQEAYDTYRRNYLQGESEIQTASAEAVKSVDEALTEQAEY